MVEGGRLVAQKARVADIVAGNVQTAEGAARVNIMGCVVAVNPEEPPSFMMDDTSALVLVRQFDKRAAPQIGSVVCVIGRVRDHQGERYIASEIVRPLDTAWVAVRSLELARASSFVTPSLVSAEERVEDDAEDADASMLAVIRDLDEGTGASLDDIVSHTGPDAEKTVQFLLRRGDVFEVSPGRIKILE